MIVKAAKRRNGLKSSICLKSSGVCYGGEKLPPKMFFTLLAEIFFTFMLVLWALVTSSLYSERKASEMAFLNHCMNQPFFLLITSLFFFSFNLAE